MKKVSLFLSLFAVCLFTACQTDSVNTETAQAAVNISPDKNSDEQPEATTVAVKTPGYKVGDVAEDFSLKGIDGKMVSMSSFPDAKGFVIVFTCNSCPVAVKYEDRVIELHEKFAAKGYPLIAINPNDPDVKPGDSFDGMIVRAKEKGFEFPYVFDEGQKVFPKFGATKTPHIFILNKDRVVEYIGSIDNNPNDAANASEKYVEKAIAALEKGEKPDPNFTKAIGCSIKSKK